MADKSSLNYPVVLVHGVDVRDTKIFRLWGRIPKMYREKGTKVFYGKQDAWGTIELNASALKKNIEKILEKTGASKVNIIAHSKGGLDSRYMISNLGMADKVASLTTITTPHRGLNYVDRLFKKLPKFFFKVFGFFVFLQFRLLGDKKPSFYKVTKQLAASSSEQFNNNNPNHPDVYYQSYAAYLKNTKHFPHSFLQRHDGNHDGVVSVDSSIWGDYKGVIGENTQRGMSHLGAIDVKSRKFKEAKILKTYREIHNNLLSRGY